MFFLAKVKEIYFDHACFSSTERQQLKVDGVEELLWLKAKEMNCDKTRLSSGGKQWIWVSLTPMVLLLAPFLF